MKNQEEKKITSALIIVCVLSLMIGAASMYGIAYLIPSSFSEIITKTEKEVTVNDMGIADAVEKVYDSVVVVMTYKKDQLVSSGTGFVYEVEGENVNILTNAHVIESGDEVKVMFTDGKVVETEIIGSNAYADVALLSVENNNYAVAEIGDNDELRVGDTLFAVGAPLDSEFSWTVTRGILSGKDRLVEVSSTDNGSYIMDVMQTDTAINSGNSGGPLCNANGEVIGINTLKLNSDGVEGMGFAIPIENAIEAAEGIKEGESGGNPLLGIGMIDLSAAYSSAYPEYNDYQDVIEELELDGGVIITEVSKNSSASEAGVKVGDIIIGFNKTKVSTGTYLRYELYKYKIGEEVTIQVIRDGKEIELDVTLKGASE